MDRLGFVGLGKMGVHMAPRLLDAGYPLTVWNRTIEKTADLASRGADVAANPAGVASAAGTVITILSDEGPITGEHLPQHFNRRQLSGAARNRPGPVTLRELEMQAIYDALERHEGNKPRASEELGISLKTLYNKINQGLVQTRAA